MTRLACFERERTLGDEHIDWLGHVNNVVWLQLVIELATAHSEAVGLDVASYQKLGAGWAVRRHELDYHLPAFSGERIRERTWIERMRGARCLRRVQFLRSGDDALLMEARSTWAFMDLASGRPRRVPDEVAARFTVLPEGP